MNDTFRTLRLGLGIGLTWGLVWAIALAVVVLVIGSLDPDSIDPGEGIVDLLPKAGGAGFVLGLIFAGPLLFMERGQGLPDFPMIRVAAWGMLVAAPLPLWAGVGADQMILTGLLGAVSALASAWAVRTASRGHARLQAPGI